MKKIMVLEFPFEIPPFKSRFFVNKHRTTKELMTGYGYSVKNLGELTDNMQEFFMAPEQFGLVLYTGGEDVSPSTYNDTSPLQMCDCPNEKRDNHEKKVYDHAIKNGIPMAGICRGMQFLNVMSKGRLMHHITNHSNAIHGFISPGIKRPIKVNSFHHQMVIPAQDSIVIGWANKNLSNKYYGRDDKIEQLENNREVEAMLFPKINACGVQYHPEWLEDTTEGFTFFNSLVRRLMSWKMKNVVMHYTKNYTHKGEKGGTNENMVG